MQQFFSITARMWETRCSVEVASVFSTVLSSQHKDLHVTEHVDKL